MARIKTFFIYLIIIVVFYIYSQVMIWIALDTTYKYKTIETKTSIPVEMEVQATTINGVAKGKIINDTDNEISNKYLKIDFYSNHDVLMGTKYIEIDKIQAKEEKEFEVHFNYNKVDKAVIDIVDEQIVENVKEEDKISDPERTFSAIVVALILVHFI